MLDRIAQLMEGLKQLSDNIAHDLRTPLTRLRNNLASLELTDAQLDTAYVGLPDYMDLGPNYADAVAYAYETFAGYLHQRAGRDYVMVLIGDHQPPALVSGEGQPWDVPMHVITNREDILDRLAAKGFVRGLTPQRTPTPRPLPGTGSGEMTPISSSSWCALVDIMTIRSRGLRLPSMTRT